MNTADEQEFIRIAILESIVEAQIMSSILEEETIPYLIRSYHDTAYNGLYQFQKGWGKLYALLTHEQEILQIVKDVRSNNFI